MKKLILAALILEAFTFRCQLQSRLPSHPARMGGDSIQFLIQDNDSVRASPGALDQLGQRPLNLPVLHPGDRCPVTKGSRESVPRAPYIFCSGCFWYGKGPVFFGLAWSDQTTDEARFEFYKVDGKGGNKLRFSDSGPEPNERLVLDSTSAGKEPTHWSFWPTSMYLPGPGCYGVQIDTLQGTDTVVFNATAATRSRRVSGR
jgi:hypothetical protein